MPDNENSGEKLPIACFHPADYLADELRARLMTTRDLAELIVDAKGSSDREYNVVKETLALNMWLVIWLSDRPDHWRNCLVGDLPEDLEKVWGTSAALWRNLDASFRAALDRGVPMERCEESEAWARQILEADDNPRFVDPENDGDPQHNPASGQ